MSFDIHPATYTKTDMENIAMKDAFVRALAGFIVLTIAIVGMSLIALWALSTFSPPDGSLWWASLLVVLLAMVTEIMIFGSTLHEPVSDWIKQPKRDLEEAERQRKHQRQLALENARTAAANAEANAHGLKTGGPKTPPPPKPKR